MSTHCTELVVVNGVDAAQTMEIVREIRSQGLVQGQDFEFKYVPGEYDTTYLLEKTVRCAKFYFREGKWATYYTLKYGT